MKSGRSFLIAAAVLGVIGLVTSVAFGAHASTARSAIGYVLDIVLLILAFMYGRAAKREGGKPMWSGAAVGAIYGFITSISAFFVRIDASLFQNNPRIKPEDVAQLVQYENSPAAHVIALIVSVIVFGVLGLVLGAIGGATARQEGPEGR